MTSRKPWTDLDGLREWRHYLATTRTNEPTHDTTYSRALGRHVPPNERDTNGNPVYVLRTPSGTILGRYPDPNTREQAARGLTNGHRPPKH